MNNMTHIDLFSGIGGFALAAKWAGFETKVFCEIDPFCQKVLKKHWPDVPIEEDIKKFDGKEWTGATLLTGGFPCQPFSQAGYRKGKTDDRFLWPEMLRIISEARPTWILGENVVGIISMEFDAMLSQLEGLQYSVQAVIIPACSINAPHRRDRVWIIANTNGSGLQGQVCINGQIESLHDKTSSNHVFATFRERFLSFRECGNVRIGYGLPCWVDRLRALGNAIVPQVAYQIIKAIAEANNESRSV